MPNTLKVIRLDRGVVSSRDPSVLGEGELVTGGNIEYAAASPSVTPMPGRTSFGTPTVAPVGLYYADFDGADPLVVARGTSTWEKATAGETGTFSTMNTGLTTATYGDGCHYLNQHFLYDGVAANKVLKSAGTTFAHGLTQATASAVAATGAGSGLTAGSTYKLWWTPYDSTNAIEGTFSIAASATISSVSIHASSGNNQIVVTSPTTPDSNADQYYVYASVAAGAYPVGYRYGPTTFGSSTTISTEPGTAPSNTAYDYVTVGGIVYGRNGQPALADAMDVFEDSIVLVDSTDKQKIRYSVSDLPHYFPAPYYIGFETAFQDVVTAIKASGNVLLVFLKTQVWRVDFLPRASDSEFERGRVKEIVSNWHGCLSPRGPAAFEIYGGQQLVAFPSYAGWMVTDGYRTDTLTDDLDWAGTVSQTALSTAITKNNPNKFRLELFFNDGSSRNKCLHAYYHPSKIKEGGTFGKYTITGPHDVPGYAACQGFLTTDEFVIYTADGTAVYLENRANTDAASLSGSSTITGRIATPRFYWSGVAGEFRVERLFAHHPSGTGSITVTPTIYRDADRDAQDLTSQTLSLSDSGATPIEINSTVQDFQVTVTGSGDWGALNYLAAEISNYGRLEGG